MENISRFLKKHSVPMTFGILILLFLFYIFNRIKKIESLIYTNIFAFEHIEDKIFNESQNSTVSSTLLPSNPKINFRNNPSLFTESSPSITPQIIHNEVFLKSQSDTKKLPHIHNDDITKSLQNNPTSQHVHTNTNNNDNSKSSLINITTNKNESTSKPTNSSVNSLPNNNINMNEILKIELKDLEKSINKVDENSTKFEEIIDDN